MHFSARVFVSTVAAFVVFGFGGAAMARGYIPVPMAHGYAGSWPVTVTDQHGSWTGCLTLSGSGSAALVSGSQKFNGGSYFITNKLLVATIPAQGYGQNAGLVFVGRAMHSGLGAGIFDEVYGGSDFESGSLTFGAKGGC